MGKLAMAGLGLVLAFAARADDLPYERIDAMVPMSDGVSLDTSLYLPKVPVFARVPLIVRQHGGGSNKDSPFDVKYALKAVETGRFAALMYSVRGHGNSQGLFDFFGPRTTQDFSEMVDWVASSYGDRIDTDRVGSSGYSQGGGESLLPAEQDARVKALAVGNTFADLNYALNPNDVFKFAFATGIFLGAYTSTLSRVDDTLAVRWGATFYADTEDVATPLFPSTTQDLASRSPLTYVDTLVARRVPVFWTNGWEDQLFPADHPQRVLDVLEAAGIPIHYWFASGGHAAGDSFLAEEESREQAMQDWFDQFLNGADHGFLTAPKVDYWERQTGDPRKPGDWLHFTAAEWPVPNTLDTVMYPQADGSLASAPAAAGESMTLINDYASANVSNDALTLEVARNVPGLDSVLEQLPENPNPLDTIVFTSAPLAAPLDVVGAPIITVAQDSTRTIVQQFDAKVWDQSDAGFQLIWRGAISGLLGLETSFKLWPNAHRFDAGHQIVLMISSVDFPTFKPDIEPWVAGIVLAKTKLEMPTVVDAQPVADASAPAPVEERGGAMPALLWLLALAALRRREP
jgi:putative CocE/NonD family hydrolase